MGLTSADVSGSPCAGFLLSPRRFRQVRVRAQAEQLITTTSSSSKTAILRNPLFQRQGNRTHSASARTFNRAPTIDGLQSKPLCSVDRCLICSFSQLLILLFSCCVSSSLLLVCVARKCIFASLLVLLHGNSGRMADTDHSTRESGSVIKTESPKLDTDLANGRHLDVHFFQSSKGTLGDCTLQASVLPLLTTSANLCCCSSLLLLHG